VNWRSHASFMNGLEAEGFVLLGGPLDGTSDVLLVVRAETAEQVRFRLSEDPWGLEMLETTRIAQWSPSSRRREPMGGDSATAHAPQAAVAVTRELALGSCAARHGAIRSIGEQLSNRRQFR
jgi:hypothetical protein